MNKKWIVGYGGYVYAKKGNEMSKSRLGPEAKIISLFTALPDDSKRIVLDIIKAQSAAPRKASTKKATASPPAQKDPPTEKNKGLCSFVYPDQSACNCAEDNPVHEIEGGYAGYHPFEPPKPVVRAGRKSKQKSEGTSSTPNIEGETENALAVSSGGD